METELRPSLLGLHISWLTVLIYDDKMMGYYTALQRPLHIMNMIGNVCDVYIGMRRRRNTLP